MKMKLHFFVECAASDTPSRQPRPIVRGSYRRSLLLHKMSLDVSH